ncbi:hypothetical protein SAMN05216324_107143 [Chryseobacterium limigenitum]|uniref:Uncharacterized protein n=1 Tax=Chryseobacterium limigenitum TaxID=1612149 RepID=A0A1K2IQZ1_9FLAO|nr:hypothetical protein SAMN05216324_107143 [Chryseobacterium limigenitum]
MIPGVSSWNKHTSKASLIFISSIFGRTLFTIVQADAFGSWKRWYQ